VILAGSALIRVDERHVKPALARPDDGFNSVEHEFQEDVEGGIIGG
jgi:hypothetical protein